MTNKVNDTALHIHVYYPELLGNILDGLDVNHAMPDLFISVPNQDVFAKVTDQLADRSYCVAALRIVPNSGRDIGPLLTEFGKEIIQKYKYIGHLHTKKSIGISDSISSKWFDFILQNLLGNTDVAMMDKILSVLRKDPSIGLIFPDDPNIVGWGENLKQGAVILDRLGIQNIPSSFLFPVGTMFWASTKALQPLIELGFEWNMYPVEPIGYDGTLLHAIERVIGFPSNGLRIATTYVRDASR